MIQFLGGEPFLQEECFRIWDMLIERGLSPRCQITTNGSIYNAKVERVLQNLPVDLSVSVDGVNKETIERIRLNNTYETLMENIGRFAAYARGVSDPYAHKRLRSNVQLNYCVMSHNWQELPDFFRFAESMKADVWTRLVTSPRHSSLFELPLQEQQAIVSQLGSQTAELQHRLSSQNRTVWLETVKELQTHATQDPSAVHQIDSAPSQKSPMHRAWALMREGKSQEALEAALRTLPTDPLYYRALVLVGEIRTTRGDYEGAEQALQSAVLLAPRHPEGYLRQAWLRYHQGRFEEGRAAVARAEDGVRAVRSPEAWLTEELLLVDASLCHRAGHPDQAREKVERFLELQPDRTDARRLRDQILALLRTI